MDFSAFLGGRFISCLQKRLSGVCAAGGAGRGSIKAERQKVRVARVAETPIGRTISATGTLAAFDQATLSLKVPGRIKLITVDLGSSVRRGELVAQVEQQDYQIRLQQAEASLAQALARLGLALGGGDDAIDPERTGTVRQARAVLNEAEATRQRASTLVKQGVIARAEYDSADAAFKVAEGRYQDAVEEVRNRQGVLSQRRSEVALARQQLADTSVYASFDGAVEEKLASVGEFLAASAPVVRVVKINPLRLRAEIAERDASSVRKGQQVKVTVDGEAGAYVGRIMRLSPTITEQNRILIAEAEVANDGQLRPGSFARAEIVTSDNEMAVTVPTSAIVTFAGIDKVILVQNGKAVEKTVATGRRAADWTEVLAGVSVGEAGRLRAGHTPIGTAAGSARITSDSI
ncbi:MAG: efflux RND transporter periplasmic adaptor subunit [Pyrinomonadaceae bacterium]